MTAVSDTTQTTTDAPLVIGGKSFTSRLLLGTGKYRSHAEMLASFEASGTQIITVALRRIDFDDFIILRRAGIAHADRIQRHQAVMQEARRIGRGAAGIAAAVGEQHDGGQRNGLQFDVGLANGVEDVRRRTGRVIQVLRCRPAGGIRKAV